MAVLFITPSSSSLRSMTTMSTEDGNNLNQVDDREKGK